MKNILILILVAATIFYGLRYFRSAPNVSEPTTETPNTKGFNGNANIFNVKVTTLGQGINKLGGFLELSPDERYVFFGGVFEEGEQFDNKILAADLTDGRLWELPGSPIGEASANGLLATAEMDKIYINHLADDTFDTYTDADMLFSGSFSPDGAKFVYNSTNGIRLIDIVGKATTEISQNRYDGAYAWYADSNRILGFRENPLDNIFEAGRGRILADWNLTAKTSTDIAVDMPSSVLRRVRWIEEGKIALVNAGWDDGSFDYIVDLDKKFVTDLGDTSGMLMGGVALDAKQNLIAMVGTEVDGPGELESATVAKLVGVTGVELGRKGFDDHFVREYAQVVDDHTIMYLRKGPFENQTTDVVYLDFKKGTEDVLYTYAGWAHNLRVTKDKKFWILPAGDTLVVKKI